MDFGFKSKENQPDWFLVEILDWTIKMLRKLAEARKETLEAS